MVTNSAMIEPPVLSTALSYWKTSKELFNLKAEKQLRLSMVPKQEREEAPNSVLK